MPSILPPEFPFRAEFRAAIQRTALGVLAATLLFGFSSRAGAGEFDVSDLHREVLIRTAMSEDPRLQNLNIIVRVIDRVATLSGPVPTRELARRALDAAKSVPEIREVRDRMTVNFDDRGLLLPVGVALPIKATAQTSLSMAPPLDFKAAKPIQATSGWRPIQTAQPALPGRPEVATLSSFQTQPSTAAPASFSKAQEPSRPSEPKRLDIAAIGTAVETLVLGEQRYRRLRWEVKDTKVYLGGTISTWGDLRELAKVLRQVPGINEVVIRDLRVEPMPK